MMKKPNNKRHQKVAANVRSKTETDGKTIEGKKGTIQSETAKERKVGRKKRGKGSNESQRNE